METSDKVIPKKCGIPTAFLQDILNFHETPVRICLLTLLLSLSLLHLGKYFQCLSTKDRELKLSFRHQFPLNRSRMSVLVRARIFRKALVPCACLLRAKRSYTGIDFKRKMLISQKLIEQSNPNFHHTIVQTECDNEPTRPDPARPGPTRPDPARPGPTITLFEGS